MLRYLNPNYVVVQLQFGRVTARVQAALLTVVALIAMVVGQPGIASFLADPPLRVFALLRLIYAIAPVWCAYRANGGSQGRDFVTRYLTLSCVLYFWVYLLGLAAYYAVYLVLYYSRGSEVQAAFRADGPAPLAFSLAAMFVYILLLMRFMARVAAHSVP